MLVVNLHAVNFELGMATFREQLNDLTALIHRHQGPVILAGDFNTWSDKREFWLNKLVGELGLQEAIRCRICAGPRSYRPLDHLYYRNLDLVEVSSPATDASDHNPIMARFAAQAITPESVLATRVACSR